ncbi:MAG: hypothetical protein OHK0048_16880 [Rhodoferax sp.]
MSQWADGGLLATKPCVSSAAYLARMGDACKGCAYDPKQRLGMVYQQIAAMPESMQENIRQRTLELR